MKRAPREPVTDVMPTRLPPLTVVVTKCMLLRKTCSRERWTDDGYVARCVRSPNHGGHCDFGVYIKANDWVTVTVSRMPKGDA